MRAFDVECRISVEYERMTDSEQGFGDVGCGVNLLVAALRGRVTHPADVMINLTRRRDDLSNINFFESRGF